MAPFSLVQSLQEKILRKVLRPDLLLTGAFLQMLMLFEPSTGDHLDLLAKRPAELRETKLKFRGSPLSLTTQ